MTNSKLRNKGSHNFYPIHIMINHKNKFSYRPGFSFPFVPSTKSTPINTDRTPKIRMYNVKRCMGIVTAENCRFIPRRKCRWPTHIYITTTNPNPPLQFRKIRFFFFSFFFSYQNLQFVEKQIEKDAIFGDTLFNYSHRILSVFPRAQRWW